MTTPNVPVCPSCGHPDAEHDARGCHHGEERPGAGLVMCRCVRAGGEPTGYACVVCQMPTDATEYAVHYQAGEHPPIPGVRFHLCPVHAAVLFVSTARPVVPVNGRGGQ